MADLAHRGHHSNPFDEPIHHGHLMTLLAPNHPLIYHGQKSGCYYESHLAPDPAGGPDRLVARVWPAHVEELLQNGYSLPPRYVPPVPAEVVPEPQPDATAKPRKGDG